jgi:hypothetical protein
MKNILLFLFVTILSINCNNVEKNIAEKSDRLGDIPEPDKHDRLLYEANEKLKKCNCKFLEPDTSLCGIILRNSKSANILIGKENKTDESQQYHFYTKQSRELITMTQHPGDKQNQISIFNVSFSGKADYGYKELNIDSTETEKGIKLNISKKELITKLGNCYAVVDSGKNFLEILYKIENPNDSRTKILEKNNMPSYYAIYGFSNNLLKNFEFGFEYP